MFALQKIAWFLLLPPASLVVVILTGLLLQNRYRQVGKGLIIAGLALLYILSLGHVADVLVKPLERRYPPLVKSTITADAVVVPGGGSVDLGWIGAAPVPNAESYARLITGVELARRLRIPLVLCGGNGEPFSTTVNDADVMAEAASAMGLPRSQVIVENKSRNTLENSHAVRRLLTGDRIILATSAYYYMKRAAAMFSRRGFSVIPAPTYYLAQTRKCSLPSFIPRSGDLARSSVAIAEWISLAWWWIRGEM